MLARNSYQLTNIVSQVLQAYTVNPTEWNWKGKTAFFWCGSAAMVVVWTFFRLPECKVRPSWKPFVCQ